MTSSAPGRPNRRGGPRISVRRARALAEMARLAALIEENQRRRAELEAEWNRPCPYCVGASS